ncbi:glycosyltransferase family 4 protein [Rhodopirellula sp. SWK7]|uniref:glycosyltransferase family 4 protein n=1 Tax=Rhodopirellula sp. SWK7 TaxID=595460 RepID=UPI0039655D78
MHAYTSSHLSRTRAWCFWGERPGVTLRGWPGKVIRRARWHRLHSTNCPIWGVGNFAIQGFKEEFGTHRKYLNIPYFSNLSRFTRPHTPTKLPRTILFSGSLIPRKGVDVLAEAFAMIAPSWPDAKLIIIGKGPLEQKLRQILDPCRNQVDFRGLQTWPSLPGHYAEADAICVPSRYDGWAMVVPEGLASGLPVITTKFVGACYDLVRNGQNGYILQKLSRKTLAESFVRLFSLPPNEFSTMSKSASDSAESHSLNNGTQRFLDAAERTYHWCKS